MCGTDNQAKLSHIICAQAWEPENEMLCREVTFPLEWRFEFFFVDMMTHC